MFLCTPRQRDDYIAAGDPIKDKLLDPELPHSPFISHKWLLDSIEKRMIYNHVYGDLLESDGQKILDVGGGFCSLTHQMLGHHEYSVLDIMAHDDTELLEKINLEQQRAAWIGADWNKFQISQNYDIIIANDLFPNVDQRLEMFLEKYLPHCQEMRLSLTCYNNNRVYKVKRVGVDEVFHMVAWDNI